jgi:hypothetical protein
MKVSEANIKPIPKLNKNALTALPVGMNSVYVNAGP